MAALHQVNEFRPSTKNSSNTAGNLARELSQPQVELPRPVRKPKRAARQSGKTFMIGAFWVITVGVSLLLVHQNSLVLREKAAITQTRAELSRLEKRNQEQEARLVQLTSVAEIERWALAQNMQRPSSAKVLTPDPAAVARRPTVLPAGTSNFVLEEQSGLWGAVRGYANLFAGLFSTKGVH